MNANAQPRSGRRGEELLLDDLRRLDALFDVHEASARDRVEKALGPELACRLLGALVPRRRRPVAARA